MIGNLVHICEDANTKYLQNPFCNLFDTSFRFTRNQTERARRKSLKRKHVFLTAPPPMTVLPMLYLEK